MLLTKLRNKTLVVYGTVFFFFAQLPAFFSEHTSTNYIACVFKFAGYLTFSFFFSKSFLSELMERADQASKKLYEIHKTINHEVKKRVYEVERVNEQLLQRSKTDQLSASLNKAAIVELIEKMAVSKPKDGFSIVMFDIDNFKNINDNFGHIVGDRCIRKLSLIAKQSIRGIDILGRYGGDEFLLVVPGTNAWQAKIIAERLKKNVEKTVSPHFTISAGIASFPHDGKKAEDLITASDEGLYLSKERGRNTISHRELF